MDKRKSIQNSLNKSLHLTILPTTETYGFMGWVQEYPELVAHEKSRKEVAFSLLEQIEDYEYELQEEETYRIFEETSEKQKKS